MSRDHGFTLTVLVLFLGSVGSPTLGGDTPSEAALKAKGLTKTLSTWVIEDEKPVLASMKEARAVFQSYAQVAERQAEAEQLAATSKQLDEQRAVLQANLAMLNQQIAQMPNPAAGMNSRSARYYQQTPANNPLLAERSQANTELAELNQMQKTIKSQIPTPKDKAGIDDEVRRRQETFKTTLTDLRKQVDEVAKKYADLAADESVKTAIEDLKKTTKAKVKLGPSDPFLAMMREVDQAERRFLNKPATASPASTKKKAKTKK